MNRGERLLKAIEEKGFTIMSLSKESGVAYTTIRSMIERDLTNASIDNVLKICAVLGIKAESLNGDVNSGNGEENLPETIAAHFDGEDYTDEELEEILEYARYLKSKRK